MDETRNVKPTPARSRAKATSGAPKPTPARELAGLDGRDAGGPEGTVRTPPDVAEAALEADGSVWKVRVLGRSGRAAEGAAPVVLLGFWEGTSEGRTHDREVTLVARTLSDLPSFRLEEAFSRSTPPAPADRRKPFFDGAGQGRRGGAARRDGPRGDA